MRKQLAETLKETKRVEQARSQQFIEAVKAELVAGSEYGDSARDTTRGGQHSAIKSA